MNPERALFPTCIIASVLWSFSAPGAGSQSATVAPPRKVDEKAVSPDARRFLPAPWFAYWAGTERVFDGELSLATPRPLLREAFLPALDNELETSAFMRVGRSIGHRDLDWRLLELGSMHEIRGGAVLATSFRYDERETKTLQGFLALTVPIKKLWLVPIAGVGSDASVAPRFIVGTDLRSNRELSYGYTLGLEASGWSDDRARVMGKAGAVVRLVPGAALEESIALGAWTGPAASGEVAVRWMTAGLQNLGDRAAVYERVTVARGVPSLAPGRPPETVAWSGDVACGFRYAIASTYGFVVQADIGALPERYRRYGIELTLYATLF
jgi:hypothetical protein